MDGIKILFFLCTLNDSLSNSSLEWTFLSSSVFLYTFENLAHGDETSLKQVINAAFYVNTDKLIYLGVN